MTTRASSDAPSLPRPPSAPPTTMSYREATKSVPGPGAYLSHASLSTIGTKNPVSKHSTGSISAWGRSRAERDDYNLMFVSQAQQNHLASSAKGRGKGTRDPGETEVHVKVTAMGSQALAGHSTAPTASFGRSTMPRFEGGTLKSVVDPSLTHSTARDVAVRRAPTYTPYSWRASTGPSSSTGNGNAIPWQGPYLENKRVPRVAERRMGTNGDAQHAFQLDLRIPPPSPVAMKPDPVTVPRPEWGLAELPDSPGAPGTGLRGGTKTRNGGGGGGGGTGAARRGGGGGGGGRRVSLVQQQEELRSPRTPAGRGGVARKANGYAYAAGMGGAPILDAGREGVVPPTSPVFRFGTPEYLVHKRLMTRLDADSSSS